MVRWDWEKLCGRTDGNFTIWNNGDFGHCFEQSVIIFPCHLIFACVSLHYLIKHRNHTTPGHIPHSPTIYIRYVTAVGLLLLPVLLLALVFLYEKIHPSLADILSWVIKGLAWLLHSSFVWRLRKYYHIHIRGPVLMFVSFLLITGAVIIQLRTVIRHMVSGSSYFDPVETYTTYITVSLHLLYSASLIPWRRAPIRGYISAYQSINDSTEQEVAARFRGYGSISSPREQLGHADDDAGLFSRLTFWWVNPLMRHGYDDNIDSSRDLFLLPARLNIQAIDVKFSSHFNLRSTNVINSVQHDDHSSVAFPLDSTKRKFLLKALNRTFGWEYYSLGILKFISDGLGFAGPLILNLLVKYMEDPTEPRWHGYVYAAALFLSTFISSVFSTQFNYHVSIVGLKIRAALITTVYKKSLRISSVTMSRSTVGEIVNFMSTDTDRIVNFCPSFHAFWSLPVQTAVSLYLLYTQVSCLLIVENFILVIK